MRKYGTKNKIRAKDHGNNQNGEINAVGPKTLSYLAWMFQ